MGDDEAARASSGVEPAGESPPAGAPLPDENPNRPREYHGRRTMVAALAVVGAVALALWLALDTDSSPSTAGRFGIAELPAYLNADQRPVAVEIGSLAPDFELETLAGERFRLSDYRGHPVVVNFWASWCVPCRREVPVLIRLQEEFRQLGLAVIGVNIEESRGPARGFADEFAIDYVLPMDFGGDVVRAYQVFGPPHTYFVGPDGVIETIFRGQAPDDVFERTVREFVATIRDPLGPALLPGLKAVPTHLVIAEGAVGLSIGATAPDFLLRRATSSWRLSQQRGRGILLAFAAADCAGHCATALGEAIAAADAAGVDALTLAAVERIGGPTDAAVDVDYQPPAAVDALFRGGAPLRLFVIDMEGVVRAVGTSVEAVEESLTPAAGAPQEASGSAG